MAAGEIEEVRRVARRVPAFAEEIIARWRRGLRIIGTGARCASPMLKLLDKVGTAQLALRFARDVLPTDYDGTEGAPLRALCRRFGWERLAPPLREFVAKQTPTDRASVEIQQIVRDLRIPAYG